MPVTTPAGEITVRVYSPEGPGPFPVHLNFHGGTVHYRSEDMSKALTLSKADGYLVV